MNIFSMIMAGGGGTRFWPLSRQDMPKQLLNLSGNDIMINETITRCETLIPAQNSFIVTNKLQAEAMDSILIESLPRENILKEPVPRNTAPCILFAAMHIFEKHGDGILCIFPSDHYITESQTFLSLLGDAVRIADECGKVVTIGVRPTFPATGYGYIKREKELLYNNAYRLDKFVEKPNAAKAKEYFASGEYYWNSGIFVWKISSILRDFERFLPRIYQQFRKLEGRFCSDEAQSLIDSIYPQLDSISIDYGILERVDGAIMIPGEFGWNDVGSWDALGAIFPSDEKGNIIKAAHIGVDTKECIIYSVTEKLIATVGVFNAIVVDTEDAMLICAKDRAQDVKYIVDELKRQGKQELL